MLSTLTIINSNPTTQLELSEATRLLSYTCVMSSVLYAYDYSLTLDREIELVWKRRLTLPTLLYLLLRYLTFLEIIFSIGTLVPQAYKLPCLTLLTVGGIADFCILIAICAIISLRIVALYNRNKYMIVMLILVNITQMGVIVYIQAGTKPQFIKDGKSQCQLDSTIFPADTKRLWWIPLFTETLLFILTLVRLYWLRRRISTLPPLLQLITRDGIVYYLIICVVYTINILNRSYNIGALKLVGIYLGVSLPALTTCRLTLNLQRLSYTNSLTSGYYYRGPGTERSLFTTFPSQFNFTSVDVGAWLTGERWGLLEGAISAPGNSLTGQQAQPE